MMTNEKEIEPTEDVEAELEESTEPEAEDVDDEEDEEEAAEDVDDEDEQLILKGACREIFSLFTRRVDNAKRYVQKE